MNEKKLYSECYYPCSRKYFHALSDKINEFHLEVVERRLNSSNLTTDEKIAIIDKILDNLKSRELDGIIK